MNKRVITSLSIIAVLTGTLILGVQMAIKRPPTADIIGATGAPVHHQTLEVTQATADATPPAPTVTPDSTPVATPKASPKDQVQTTQAPVTYKWAADMASFGISESDYSYVTTMLLDDNGWRTTGPHLWQGNGTAIGAQNNEPTLLAMLPRAITWVNKFYGGSWSAAYSTWTNLGNF